MPFTSVLGSSSVIKPGVCTSTTRPTAPYVGQLVFETDTNRVAAYTASGWVYAHSSAVLQVKSTSKTDVFTTTSSTFTDITGLSVSITPTSASNKVLVMLSLSGSNNVGTAALNFRIDRGGTAIAIGDAAGSRDRVTGNINLASSAAMTTNSLTFLDSPATTSATTYKVQGRNTGAGTFFINRPETDTDAATTPRGQSTITVMEVAP